MQDKCKTYCTMVVGPYLILFPCQTVNHECLCCLFQGFEFCSIHFLSIFMPVLCYFVYYGFVLQFEKLFVWGLYPASAQILLLPLLSGVTSEALGRSSEVPGIQLSLVVFKEVPYILQIVNNLEEYVVLSLKIASSQPSSFMILQIYMYICILVHFLFLKEMPLILFVRIYNDNGSITFIVSKVIRIFFTHEYLIFFYLFIASSTFLVTLW